MRKEEFAPEEHYHVYNHGVEGRDITCDSNDSERFLESLKVFNSTVPVGGIFEFHKRKEGVESTPLVKIIDYCLNPNHFHLLLEQIADNGISLFLHRHTMGYAKYFNRRYKRRGRLFASAYNAKHITENDYLLYASVYVSRNTEVHRLKGHSVSSVVRSSWNDRNQIGKTSATWLDNAIIQEQFKNHREYREYADEALELILENKLLRAELEDE